MQGHMKSNNRWNAFAHDESMKLSSTISLNTIVTYPFLIVVLSKLFSTVFSASISEMVASDSVESMDWPGRDWIGPWARV